ncbi:MAG: response regulator transcription factor FixJ [Afipia sp.]|nr:response regulator transcription factor FixJ [Afipia sp.]
MAHDRTVHVIDDDEAVRDSLAFLLSTAKMPVKSYASASDFLPVLSSLKGGCIVTDIRMPGMSGLELLARIKELKLGIPVIVITGHGDVPLAVEAMKLGASDFVEKPFDDSVLLASIETALSAEAASSDQSGERLELRRRIETLSARERQVLEGLVLGHPNKTIAFDLQISPRTVEVYRANLMTKMSASSLSELIRMAFIAGMMSHDTADAALLKSNPKKD